MTEHTLVDAFQEHAKRNLTGSLVLWKIADRFTLDQPDTEICWRGFTTKIEFKYLRKGVGIHDELGVGQQLTCQKYEEASQRCWVIAWAARDPKRLYSQEHTRIYRPSSLYKGAEPSLEVGYSLEHLWMNGGMIIPLFNHHSIVELIKDTHK